MAFSFGNGSGGGRGRMRGYHTMSEMNIVPLVDVVLVLLIIFMLTAHVMEFGLEVDVPKVKTVKDSTQELPVINITRNGELYLNDKTVNINELGDQVRQRFPNSKAVFLRADKATICDPIAQVISSLGEVKLEVKVVTQPEDEADKKKP
jgi:biopolymer transport protein ExbD